jgi:uncharacterized membrane protein
MTPEDRELLQALRQQQADLKRIVARLDLQLAALERRAGETEPSVSPPPAPVRPPPPPMLPVPPVMAPAAPVAAMASVPAGMPPPTLPPVPAHLPPPPTPPAAPKPSLEFRFGRWLTVIGAVFGVITLALIFSLTHALIFRLLGPGGILGVSALACVAIVIGADRLERGSPRMLYFARSLMAMGLAGLYVTFYAAHSFDSVQIIRSPFLVGLCALDRRPQKLPGPRALLHRARLLQHRDQPGRALQHGGRSAPRRDRRVLSPAQGLGDALLPQPPRHLLRTAAPAHPG